MKKIPFEIVELELVKIYNNFSETNPQKIEDICNLATEFVLASGWSIESYITRLMNFEKLTMN